LTAAN